MSEPDQKPPPDNEPVPLALAATLFFPHGGVTVTSLRTEARKGRLEITRIAGKDFTTAAAIRRMMRACLVERKAPGSTSTAAKDGNPTGLSETERFALSGKAALASAERLRKRSRDTSKKSTSRSSENVIPLASRSPTS